MKKIGNFPFGPKIFIFGPKQVQRRRRNFFRTENIYFRSETTTVDFFRSEIFLFRTEIGATLLRRKHFGPKENLFGPKCLLLILGFDGYFWEN